MGRYTGPKHKHCRREGVPLCGSAKCPVLRNPNPPGQQGVRGRRKLSEYGIQLREKQKAKRMYGIFERQFRRLVTEAQKSKKATGEKLLQILETRLDNVVYRLGFAPTRSMARQLVSHGHVLVDGKKVNIPSYELVNGQTVTLAQKSLEIPLVKKTLEASKEESLPSWIERKGPVGKVAKLPSLEDFPQEINQQLIVEYYSR
ncbi:MAG TPA: 30S ribosomal protein S4 [Patescibacteria group bacterium]